MGQITVSGTLTVTLGGRNVKHLPVWPTTAGESGIVPTAAGIDNLTPFSTNPPPIGYSLTSMPSLTSGTLPLSDNSSGSAGIVYPADIASTGTGGLGQIIFYDAGGNVGGQGAPDGSFAEFLKGYAPFSGTATGLIGKFSLWAMVHYGIATGPGTGEQNQAASMGDLITVGPSGTGIYIASGNVSGRLVRFLGDSTHVGLGKSSTGGIMQPLSVMNTSDDFTFQASQSITSSAADAGATAPVTASWRLDPYCLPAIGYKLLETSPSALPLAGCHVRIEALLWDNSRYLIYESDHEYAPIPAPGIAAERSLLEAQPFDPYFGKDPLSDTSYVLLYTLILPNGASLQNWNKDTRWGHTLRVTGHADVTVDYWVIENFIGDAGNSGPTTLILDGDPENLSSGGSPLGIYADVVMGSSARAPGALSTLDTDISGLIFLADTPGDHWVPLNAGGPLFTVYHYDGAGAGASHHLTDGHKRSSFVGQKDGSPGGTGLTLYSTKDGGATYQGTDIPTGGAGAYPTQFISRKTGHRRVLYTDGTNLMRAEAIGEGETGSWATATIHPGAYPTAVTSQAANWDTIYAASLDVDTLKVIVSFDGARNFVDAGMLPDTLDFTYSGRAALAMLGTRLILAYSGPHPTRGDSHVLACRTSIDEGTTWSDPVTALEGNVSALTMVSLEGQLFLACCLTVKSHRKLILLAASQDLGQTWTPLTDIPTKALQDNVSSALGVIHRTGRLLYGPGFYTDDIGQTWQPTS